MKKLLFLFFLISCTAVARAQQLQEDLSLKYLVNIPHDNYKKIPLVILLHGYGSNEQDLLSLKDGLPIQCITVSARAPYTAPGGGYQWYELTMKNGRREGNAQQMALSSRLIGKFVNELVKKYKVDANNVFLVGFSQGGIMCYMAGLTRAAQIKGIGVLSGKIDETAKAEMAKTAAYDLRIFAGHGTDDQVIPYQEGKAAADYAKSLGYRPELRTYRGMNHTISAVEQQYLTNWLKTQMLIPVKQ